MRVIMDTLKKGGSHRNADSRRQLILIFLCWGVYVANYLGRYGYNSNINSIMSHYGVSHSDAGLVTTFFFFAYGAGQIINGVFCSKYNYKIVLPAAFLVSALINLTVFFLPDLKYIKYLWLLNGFAQSVTWPSLIRILGQYLENEKLKTSILVMSTSTATGTFITYGVSALLNKFGLFRFSFGIGFAILACAAVVWFLAYDKLAVEPEKTDDVAEKTAQSSVSVSNGRKTALFIFIVLGLFAVIDNFIKDGLSTWVPSILKEQYGFEDSLSIAMTLVLPVVGIFGATVAVFINNKIKDFVVLSGALFATAAVILPITLVNGLNYIVLLLVFGIVYLLMSGINNVVTSMSPLYLRQYFNSGRTAGLLNGCCYVGSTISSYLLGVIADHGGWTNVFTTLTCCTAFAVLCTAVYALVIRLNVKKASRNGAVDEA